MSAERDVEVSVEIACAKKADAINVASVDTNNAIAQDALTRAVHPGLDIVQSLIQVGVKAEAEVHQEEEADITREPVAEEMTEIEDTEEVQVTVTQEALV